VLGTADPRYDPSLLSEVQGATSGEMLLIVGADHGMEIARDPVKSIEVLGRVAHVLASFLA
jgi:hypothetical protein